MEKEEQVDLTGIPPEDPPTPPCPKSSTDPEVIELRQELLGPSRETKVVSSDLEVKDLLEGIEGPTNKSHPINYEEAEAKELLKEAEKEKIGNWIKFQEEGSTGGHGHAARSYFDEEEEGEGEGDLDGQGQPFYGSFPMPSDDLDDEALETAYYSKYTEEEEGEVEEVPLGQKELSKLSLHSLDEMIRVLQGDISNTKDEEPTPCTLPRKLEGKSSLEGTQVKCVPSSILPEDEKSIVLGPNHPKMKKFQEALKQHLEKQIYAATCEERELENELKMTKKEREDLGKQLYNLQYELARQTETLEKQEKRLECLQEKRTNLDNGTAESRELYFKVEVELRKEIDEEKRVMKMVKEMDVMEWCVSQAAREYDGELLVCQKIEEQFRKLQLKTESGKRDQDFYLDRVMAHVQRMEQANDGIQRQITAHLEEQHDLNSFIAEAGTEIEALQIEKLHLQRAWNETISVVRARDEALAAARNTLLQAMEEFRNREAELRSLTRAIVKEQENHEELTALLKRRKMEERHLRSQLNAITQNLTNLQSQLGLLEQVKSQVEVEYNRALNNLSKIEKEIHGPRRRVEALGLEKAALEDKIFHIMQEQMAMDKVGTNVLRKIQLARDKTRATEAEVAKVENDMTKMTVVVETLRTELLRRNMMLEDLEKKLQSQEKVLQAQANDLKQSDRLIIKRTNAIENLQRKLNKLLEDNGGLDCTPLEKEIEEIEKALVVHQNACVELQDNWLKLQDELVNLTVVRDSTINENDLIRKEVFIMERKQVRLEEEVTAKKKQLHQLNKSLETVRVEVMLLNQKLYAGREEREQMDKENVLFQNELICVLKDAEGEAIDLQNEIADLEQEKERLNQALKLAHAKCLLWEKKVKMARELKDTIKKEQETSTSALKLAIHHMQVRFNELKRIQEKLMLELNRCLEKRERVMLNAEHNIARNNIHPTKIKLNIQRNAQKIAEQNQELEKEAKQSWKEVFDLQDQIQSLEQKLESEKETVKNLNDAINDTNERFCIASIEKQKNFIEIMLRQMKYKFLQSIDLNCYRPPRTQAQLEQDIAEIETKCYYLVELCDILLYQHPEFALDIKVLRASILANTTWWG